MGMLLIEPAIVPTVFVTGTAEPVDLKDGNILFTAYARQRSFSSENGADDLVIVNRVVMPFPAVILSMRQTVRVLGIACFCRAAHAKLLIH